MTGCLLKITNLHVHFQSIRGPVHAVRGVDLCARAGEAVGIVGESGSGKSTVARTIVGLVEPSDGRIDLDGDQVAGKGGIGFRRANRWKAQMVFQDPYASLDPLQSPRSAIAEAVYQWRSCSRSEARDTATELLRSVGISDKQGRGSVRALSGGQRQRVSIARALAPAPKLLIADEPTSSLDQSAQAGILNLLARIQAERDLTVVFISHDLALVSLLTTQVLVMKDGSVVERGDTDVVLTAPSHSYTQQLVKSVL